MKRLVLSLLFIAPTLLFAQKPATDSVKAAKAAQAKKSTTPKLTPYDSLINAKAVTHKGLFTVHKIDDKYYFEIPDSIMGRQIMAITRYIKTPADGKVYGGELVNQQVIYWQKGQDNDIYMRVAITMNVSQDSSDAIYKAVRSSNVDPIVAAFKVKAYDKDSSAVVIDVTDYFKGDNQVVSLTPADKKKFKLAALAADKSYIERIATFPINTEVHSVKTYAFSGAPRTSLLDAPLPSAEQTGFVTLELNTSFLLLPKAPMKKRYFDPRVGYFADQFSIYDDSLQRVKEKSVAVRWRLEPRPEDMDKYRRGELVVPKKPIVYYIDPATPVKWRKYLIQGIQDWQKAFEQAGFKDAIIAKMWPEHDTSMSMEDARYSVLRYFASPIENAYGPNIHDPRSGEILESHIGWYHNVMKVLHDWYMIQAGAIDPRARTMVFNDSLMGQLIRFVSSHEIGHTLGLRHNMGASYATPVEKLRDKKWVEKNGHTVSIMDYARFNYVAQPEDHVGPAGIYPHIGVYDKWAIEWGYKYFPDTTSLKSETAALRDMTTKRLKADKRLWFGGEGIIGDPRSQSEDLGDNSMKASTYGIMNLKRVIRGLPEWTKQAGDAHENLAEMYKAVIDQYFRYCGHVLKNIAGVYYTLKMDDEPGKVIQPVSKALQKEALNYLNKQVFTPPLWLVDTNILSDIPVRAMDVINNISDKVLGAILSSGSLLNIINVSNSSKDPYTIEEFLTDIQNDIWSELKTDGPVNIYRRYLQNVYIDKLSNLIKPEAPANGISQQGFMVIQPNAQNSDLIAIVRVQLQQLNKQILDAIPKINDDMTKYHYLNVDLRIKKALSIKD